MATTVQEVLGDPAPFLRDVVDGLGQVGIDVRGLPVSHVGHKAATDREYVALREALRPHASAIAENVHNGRSIAKVLLAEPLVLDGWTIDLVELMPPKDRPARRLGLEHVGFVVGDDLEPFAQRHAEAVTARQDQGPWCHPACVVLSDGRRAKFYERSLRAVVEAEGGRFVPVA